MAGTNNKPAKFRPSSPVIPGRGVDWQIGANQPERDTYKLLRELERNKAEIGTIILTPPSQDQDALIWNGTLLQWENSQKYITTQPKALGRNVISPTGDFSALKLRRFSAGQTNPIQTWETEGGTVQARIKQNGNLIFDNDKRIYSIFGLDETVYPQFINAFGATLGGPLGGGQTEMFHIQVGASTNDNAGGSLYGVRCQSTFQSPVNNSGAGNIIGASFVGTVSFAGTGQSVGNCTGGEFVGQLTTGGGSGAVGGMNAGTFNCVFTGNGYAVSSAMAISCAAPGAPGVGTTVANLWGIRIQNQGNLATGENVALNIEPQTTGPGNFAIRSIGQHLLIGNAATDKTLVVRGFAAQTANLLSCQDSAGGELLNVLPAGDVEFRRTSSTTAGRLTGWIKSTFAVNTDASRTGRNILYASDFTPADRECLRWETSGTAAMLGFLGAAAVVRPTAYTQTFAATARTVPAYTTNAQSVAYTGAADGEAKLADLNLLRLAYENLRLSYDETVKVLNSVIDDHQAYGLLA